MAHSYGRRFVQPGDEILITAMEHHSNIVPWQMLCEERGARLRVAPISDAGELLLEEFERLLTTRTRLVAVAHVSNALGTVNPIASILQMAHSRNIPVLVDGAQAAPHCKVNVQELDCDFYQGGGDMIRTVSFEKTTYNTLPYKFEAGTPHIAGVIGLGAAVDYVSQIGLERASAHERQVLEYATEEVGRIPGVRLIGTARDKACVLSFVLEGVHPHDVGTILDRQGVAVRAGHHCAMPVMERFGIAATTRASFALYNTRQEVDALVAGIHKVREVFC